MNPKVPTPAQALLDFIAKYESGGNYLAYYGKAKNLIGLPATLAGVLLWQEEYVRQGHPSSAIGRYQFMPKTLEGLMKQYSILGTTAFTTDFQDLLAYYLLIGRGYVRWIAGTISDGLFADDLSKEWASLPYQTGKSYYDGDGLNHALVSRSVFMEALTSAKQEKSMTATTKATAPSVQAAVAKTPHVNFITGIINTAENFISSIESSISVAVSPNNTVTVGGSGSLGGVFSSITQAQTAVSELGKVIADAKSGTWANEPEDVMDLLKTVFAILSNFGINVPILSQLIAVMPTLPAVVAPTGASS